MDSATQENAGLAAHFKLKKIIIQKPTVVMKHVMNVNFFITVAMQPLKILAITFFVFCGNFLNIATAIIVKKIDDALKGISKFVAHVSGHQACIALELHYLYGDAKSHKKSYQ